MSASATRLGSSVDLRHVELRVRANEREAALAEPPLEHRRAPISPRRRAAGPRRDRRVAARVAERLEGPPAVTCGQSTGRKTQTSFAAARSPATTPAIGARTSTPSSSDVERQLELAALADGEPLLARLAERRATRAPRASRPRTRASAFGEPKRSLAPPTSRTPVSGRCATARCRRSSGRRGRSRRASRRGHARARRRATTAHRRRRGADSPRRPPSARARTRAGR